MSGERDEQPTLSDGTVTLRPWREEDLAPAAAGQDDLIARWAGLGTPPGAQDLRRVVEGWHAAWAAGRRGAGFVVEAAGEQVGSVEVAPHGSAGGSLTWTLYAGHRGRGYATRAVRAVAEWALTGTALGGLGLQRVEALVDPRNEASLRVATRSGLRREGLQRVVAGMGERPDATEYVVLARLATDPPLTDPGAFRTLLNSFLPRKRGIAQMLARDHDGRVLLCQLTYKDDWDLPGGVVEVGESPRTAAAREVSEELALPLEAGALLVTDWLPPWGGWDDAVCLVFDGGTHDPAVLDGVELQTREIRSAAFCTPAQVRERCADFTARRIEAALAGLEGTGPAYVESGRPT